MRRPLEHVHSGYRNATSGFAPIAPWLAAILAWVPSMLFAQGGVTRPVDLRQEAALMRRIEVPMLVLFSQTGCNYCEKARTRYIAPMSKDLPWKMRALFRQIDLDSDDALIDFSGRETTHREFAKAAGVFVTPTVMLFGPDEASLAEPIVGVTLPDFYEQYLEQAIELALEKLAGAH